MEKVFIKRNLSEPFVYPEKESMHVLLILLRQSLPYACGIKRKDYL